MIPRYPVYLFDVDGTLVDSADDICGAILEALKPTRVNGLGKADLVQYVGVHLLQMFQELLPECTLERHEELIRNYRSVYTARGHRSTRVFPGVSEALRGLGGRKSTATTKATSTTRASATPIRSSATGASSTARACTRCRSKELPAVSS